MVVGAGGAAAGAVEALTAAGARVRVVARRPAGGRAMKARLPARQPRAHQRGRLGRAGARGARWRAPTMVVSAVPAAAWEPERRAPG